MLQKKIISWEPDSGNMQPGILCEVVGIIFYLCPVVYSIFFMSGSFNSFKVLCVQ